jgi:ATP-dependent Clp protease adapter protein ClpS
MGRGAAAVETKRTEEVREDLGAGGDPWKTTLFNCECHTFDEVEKVVMKATRCTLSQARRYSWEVHTKGSAVIYTGPRERCEAVAEVVASIGLRVDVSQ